MSIQPHIREQSSAPTAMVVQTPRSRFWRAGPFSFALLVTPGVVWSQEPPAIVRGSRIRITELGAGRNESRSGTVVTAGADTIVLSFDSGGVGVPFALARISRIEVSRGRKGHIAAGVGLGFLAGAGTGALVGGLAAPKTSKGSGIHAVLGAGIGAGAGMLVGAGIGAFWWKTERWEAVPSSRWHVSAWPGGPGMYNLALSIRF